MAVLDYAAPPARRGTSYFTIAVTLPLFFVLFSTLVLDDGTVSAICVSAAGGSWVGTILVAIRRRRNLTTSDRLFLVAGYPILLVVSVILAIARLAMT